MTSVSLSEAYSPDLFRRQAIELVDILTAYLKQALDQSYQQVSPYRTPDQQLAHFQAIMESKQAPDLKHLWDELLKGAIRLHHPHYMGHQVTAPLPLTALGELFDGVLNNSMAVYEMGPSMTVLEHLVVRRICRWFDLPDTADGVMTSGGSLGNLTALLSARQAQTAHDVWQIGNGKQQLAVMVSEAAHYSVERAVKIMGLGQQGLVFLPTDDKFCVRTEMLEASYQEACRQGKQVFAIVGNACSTATGSYDNLEAMADFARKHKLWFHVDGAHGAVAALCQEYQHLTAGIEKADSVLVDFHKLWMTSSLTTAVLFARSKDSYCTFSQEADYLLSDQERWYDSAARTVECTKTAIGLKFFLPLYCYGRPLFEDYVRKVYQLARDFADILTEAADFELFMMPMSNIVCFRYCPKGLDKKHLSEYNKKIRQKLLEEACFYIVQTQLNGQLYLRTALMNPFIERSHLLDLLAHIRKLPV